MGKKDILPPRKKDWKPGNVQLGLFIRFETGAKVEFAVNEATTPEVHAAVKLLTELTANTSRLKP